MDVLLLSPRFPTVVISVHGVRGLNRHNRKQTIRWQCTARKMFCVRAQYFVYKMKLFILSVNCPRM